jgi:hypothetical protein
MAAFVVTDWRRGAFIAVVTLTTEFVFFLLLIPHQVAFAASMSWIHSRAEHSLGAGKRAIELLPLASSLAWAPLLIAFLVPRIPVFWAGWASIASAAFLQGSAGSVVLSEKLTPRQRQLPLAIAIGAVTSLSFCPYYYLALTVYRVMEVPQNVGSLIGRLW